jgi:4-aminobutyrate aminotransferase-like enzyme
LGKPIGNGHPIGVVVTTNEIAENFANGIEYFSTFGGSTLSCCIGAEVLKIVEDENLQQNARLKGERLFEGLRKLQNCHSLIGDVRGFGLFVGVELITDECLTPATEIASFIVNRMKQERILIGVEGPFDNILKIRPPLTISNNDIDCILQNLDNSLSEAALLTDELRNII